MAVVAVLLALVAGFAIGRATASTTATGPTPAASVVPTPDASVVPTPTASVVPSDGTSPPVVDAATALETLARLTTVDGRSDGTYDRDLFGQRWADVDRNGCDTRNDILGRDLLDPVFKAGTGDCKVLSGRLIDPYDGTAVDFVSGADTSGLVQIDHVVALGWAWRHGASTWTDEQRTAFANDPRNLVASSEDTNQSKSDSGPRDWLPDAPELRCGFVQNWVGVLGAYGLGIDDDERTAAAAVLETC